MDRRKLRIFLDVLFPPTAHEQLLRDYSPTRFSQHLRPQMVANILTLSQYHEPVVQAAIGACKFERNQHAAKLLAALLQTWLTTYPASGNTLLIAIPLSTTRLKERGFNQVSRVLTYLPADAHLHVESSLMQRTVHTQRQTSLGRTKRKKNITGAFSLTPQARNYNWSNISRVIICDDVVTTGATLEEAAATLRPLLPSHVTLTLLAWAH